MAGRRPGSVPLRPADPLDDRAPRRPGGALRHPRPRRRREGCPDRRERLEHPGAPLPAAGAGGPAFRRDLFRGPQGRPAPALRHRRSRRAAAGAWTRGCGKPPEAWRSTTRACRREWRDLVEYPTVVAGDVPDEFRSLPLEVLETVLRHHQKYVPLRDGDGRVARFAAVVNGDGASAPEIVRGMERVVVARLRDGAFFLNEDRKRRLASRIDDLAGVTFHRGLGTYQDKAERMARLVGVMGERGLLDTRGLATAEEAPGWPRPTSPPSWSGSSPSCRASWAASTSRPRAPLPRCQAAVRWHYHPVAVEEDAAPAASLRRPGRASPGSSPRWPSPTSSTLWPATSGSARAPPGAGTPSACGVRARGSSASCWTSGAPGTVGAAARPAALWPRPRSTATGDGLKRPAEETVRAPRAVPARAVPVRSRGPRASSGGGPGGAAGRRARARGDGAGSGRSPGRRGPRGRPAPGAGASRARTSRLSPPRSSGRGTSSRSSSRHRRWTRRCSKTTPSGRCTARWCRRRPPPATTRRACAGSRGSERPVDRFFDDVLVMAEDPSNSGQSPRTSQRYAFSLLSHRRHFQTRIRR